MPARCSATASPNARREDLDYLTTRAQKGSPKLTLKDMVPMP
ncbi:hypothetical protein AB0333_11860 [Citricoccus sp. NPDC079358]